MPRRTDSRVCCMAATRENLPRRHQPSVICPMTVPQALKGLSPSDRRAPRIGRSSCVWPPAYRCILWHSEFDSCLASGHLTATRDGTQSSPSGVTSMVRATARRIVPNGGYLRRHRMSQVALRNEWPLYDPPLPVGTVRGCSWPDRAAPWHTGMPGRLLNPAGLGSAQAQGDGESSCGGAVANSSSRPRSAVPGW